MSLSVQINCLILSILCMCLFHVRAQQWTVFAISLILLTWFKVVFQLNLAFWCISLETLECTYNRLANGKKFNWNYYIVRISTLGQYVTLRRFPSKKSIAKKPSRDNNFYWSIALFGVRIMWSSGGVYEDFHVLIYTAVNIYTTITRSYCCAGP